MKFPVKAKILELATSTVEPSHPVEILDMSFGDFRSLPIVPYQAIIMV